MDVKYEQPLNNRLKDNFSNLMNNFRGTNTLVYYGLSLYSISLSGNVYYNFIFGSLIEIPGTTIAWVI